jgi:hypothetical protein
LHSVRLAFIKSLAHPCTATQDEVRQHRPQPSGPRRPS